MMIKNRHSHYLGKDPAPLRDSPARAQVESLVESLHETLRPDLKILSFRTAEYRLDQPAEAAL